ncbi:hypothetical protein [uncultured Serinicoccus sp.]|nr:hypothetical protein [uncultured Serinicoccus sp.]
MGEVGVCRAAGSCAALAREGRLGRTAGAGGDRWWDGVGGTRLSR